MPPTAELLALYTALDPTAREMWLATGKALLRIRSAKLAAPLPRLTLVPRALPYQPERTLDSPVDDVLTIRAATPIGD